MRPGRVAPKSGTSNTRKGVPFEDSQRLIIFVLHMYKQLISEQRSQIFALLQRKTQRKEIARIVGISQSTLSRELRRNSSPAGKYIWFKAHDKAMERRKRSTGNAALAPELMWRIKQIIIEEQWSPRQISGALRKEGVSVSHQSIYNIIHADTTGELPAIRATSSNIGTGQSTRLFPLQRGPAFINVPNKQMENASGTSRWI